MKCPICGSSNLIEDFLAEHEVMNDIVRIETALHCDDCDASLLLTQKYKLGDPFDVELESV